jgi:N4-gp56 family major capsid protein
MKTIKFDLQMFAADADATKLDDQVNPQVMADMISAELPNAIRFTPLAEVDTTLQGTPGSKITFPAFVYSGDASEVAEGEAIPVDKLTTTTKQVAIKKAGKGIKLTDESVLSGYGDPVGEVQKQLKLAIASKINKDILAAAQTATQTATVVPDVEGVSDVLDVFADEDAKAYVLLAHPLDAAKIRKDANTKNIGSEVGANALINGTYADVLGAQIVRTRDLEEGSALLIKVADDAPALKLVLKRDVTVEDERQAGKGQTVYYGNEHYAAYLYDPTKVVKVTFDSTPS